MDQKIAIIVGAGPAGLTAAYELLNKTDIKPILFELTGDVGGIAKTVNYKGNRMDMGGHRFFSKSERVMNWWLNILPLQTTGTTELWAINIGESHTQQGRGYETDPNQVDRVMLVRKRLSRIFYERKLYNYPISLNRETIINLGFFRMLLIGGSYIKNKLIPIRNISNLEDFFISRFGRQLYLTFFKDYTEKVWGVPCGQISPDWGRQRVKGLSIMKAILHSLKNVMHPKNHITQKDTETSLIETFLYPKYGPGQMWEETAHYIIDHGGEIHFNNQVTSINSDQKQITSVQARRIDTGETKTFQCDYLISTMPVKELIQYMGDDVPQIVQKHAQGLIYRNFITVGLLLKKLKLDGRRSRDKHQRILDNWIYIQEKDVKLGRIQIFNNWSPYLVKDPNTYWIGLEYFCNQDDEMWCMASDEFIRFAIGELHHLGICSPEDVLDSTIIRVPNAYPAYFGSYENFNIIRRYTDTIPNLFLIGRNGMHRYNNQDHSMLTAMTAIDNIVNQVMSKENIWAVNTENDYMEKQNRHSAGGPDQRR